MLDPAAVSAASTPILTTTAAVTRADDGFSNQLYGSVPVPATGTYADPALWTAPTAYTTGQQVTYGPKIYQRINAPTATVDSSLPSDNAALAIPTKWIDAGYTNAYRVIDTSPDTQTQALNEMSLVFRPFVAIDVLGLINVDAWTVRCYIPGTNYDRTVDLQQHTDSDWLNGISFQTRREVIFTDIPLIQNVYIVLVFKKEGNTVGVGHCVAGRSKTLGGTRFSPSAGIIDYSRRDTDAFGRTTVVERGYSKRMSVQLMVPANKVDDVQQLLTDLRATPVLYMGAGSLYTALVAFGFYRSFETVIAYANWSLMNLEIEGTN
jgi:hypothetical protein